MEQHIEQFTPRGACPGWDLVADGVRDLVIRAQPSVPYKASELLSVLARIAVHCYMHGITQPNEWLNPARVDWFLDTACAHLAPGTRGTYRSRLKSLRQAIYGPDNGVGKPISFTASDAARPYTPAEQAALWSCAKGQPTDSLRRGLMTILTLGFGCGLDSAEAMKILTGHVRLCGDAGTVVHVPPPRERLVVCRRRWEPALREVVADTRQDYLLRPGAPSRGKNLVTNLLARAHRSPATPAISPARMRSTWITELLSAHVPLTVVVAASGLETLRSLDRLLPYLPSETAERAAEWLRGSP